LFIHNAKMKRTIPLLLLCGMTAAAAQDPVRTAFISYDRFEDAVSYDPAESPWFFSLDGPWEVEIDGVPAKIEVPGYFAEKSPEALAGLRPPALPAENPVARYRRRIEIPVLWLDRDIYLRFEGLKGGLTLYVNGRQVGTADEAGPVEFNIAPFVTDGPNEIVFDLAAWSPGDWLRNGSLDAAGIEGGIRLWSQYKIHIDDFTADATLDSLCTTGILNLDVALVNRFNFADTVTLHYYVLDGADKVIRRNSRQVIVPGQGRDTVRFTGLFPAVKPWTPGAPERYRLMMRVDYRGRIVEYIPRRIGFRRLETTDAGYFLNGKPLEINEQRYDSHGIRRDRAAMRADLLSIRQKGFNTIRCGYHPDKATLYDLCAELGLLVCDEATLDTSQTGESLSVGGTPANDPAWAEAYRRAAENTWRAGRNATAVVAWSLGKGPGVGYNIYRSYLKLKALEPVRPITYPSAGELWCNDPF
jgi:beta-galactosidase